MQDLHGLPNVSNFRYFKLSNETAMIPLIVGNVNHFIFFLPSIICSVKFHSGLKCTTMYQTKVLPTCEITEKKTLNTLNIFYLK